MSGLQLLHSVHGTQQPFEHLLFISPLHAFELQVEFFGQRLELQGATHGFLLHVDRHACRSRLSFANNGAKRKGDGRYLEAARIKINSAHGYGLLSPGVVGPLHLLIVDKELVLRLARNVGQRYFCREQPLLRHDDFFVGLQLRVLRVLHEVAHPVSQEQYRSATLHLPVDRTAGFKGILAEYLLEHFRRTHLCLILVFIGHVGGRHVLPKHGVVHLHEQIIGVLAVHQAITFGHRHAHFQKAVACGSKTLRFVVYQDVLYVILRIAHHEKVRYATHAFIVCIGQVDIGIEKAINVIISPAGLRIATDFQCGDIASLEGSCLGIDCVHCFD